MNNLVKKELHDISENPEKTKTKIKELYIELEGNEDIRKRISLLGQIGVNQRSILLLTEAELSFEEVLSLVSENNLSIAFQVQNEIRLAHVYQWQERYNLSNNLFEKVINTCLSQSEASQYLDFAYQHYGKNLFDQKLYFEALKFFEQALKLRSEKNASNELMESTREAIRVTTKYL